MITQKGLYGIHDPLWFQTAGDPLGIGDRIDMCVPFRLNYLGAVVWRNNHVGHVDERVVRLYWFDLGDIESCALDLAVTQSLC